MRCIFVLNSYIYDEMFLLETYLFNCLINMILSDIL